MIDTSVSLVAPEALETNGSAPPPSPKYIRGDETLAELETIRAGWIALARAQQIPERLFEIGYWLGSQAPDNRGIFRLCTIGDMRIWASVKQGTYNIPAQAWNTTRRLTVYLDAGQQQQVADWQWLYIARSPEEIPDLPIEGRPAKLLFIPGEWVAEVLALSGQAERTRIGIARAAEDKERDALARRLLVGMEV